MKLSKFYLKTYKNCPVETELKSTELLYRGGFIKLVDNGSYSYTPLGKIFMDELKGNIGAGFEDFMEIELNGDRCALMDSYLGELKSYKELPLNIAYVEKSQNPYYKFKDGLFNPKMDNRIRFTSAVSADLVDETLKGIHEKTASIMEAINIGPARFENGSQSSYIWSSDYDLSSAYKADGLGGMADDVVIDSQIEKSDEELFQREEVLTPDIRTIEELVDFMGISPEKLIKTLLFNVKGEIIALSIRGDRDVNSKFLARYLHVSPEDVLMANEEEVKLATDARTGFAGPIGIKARLIVDEEVLHIKNGVVGANKDDYHIKNVSFGRDFESKEIGNFKSAFEGALVGGKELEAFSGSKLVDLSARESSYTYLNSSGREEKLMLVSMDFYLDRIMAAIVEENHDDKGIVWPEECSPIDYHIIIGNAKKEEEVEIGTKIYKRFLEDGFNVLLDDRKERIGFKFKDSELMGIPESVVIGKKLSEGLVEFKDRRTFEVEEMQLEVLINKQK